MNASPGERIDDLDRHHRTGLGLSAKLESGILILFGLGAAWFALSQNYGLLMEPKFRWVTFGGALVVLAMGAMGWFHSRRAGFAGSTSFLLLLAIILIGKPFSENSSSAIMTGLRVPDANSVENPDFPLKDIKELHSDLDEMGDALNGLAFSALGTVKRLSDPKGKDLVALMRSYMVCCAADALALGFRVEGDGINAFKENEWVVVRGRLTQLSEPAPIAPFRMGTATFSMVNGEYAIESVEVVALTTTLPSLTEQLSTQNTARFNQALEAVGLLNKLEEKGPFTVFAPINEAFATPEEGEESLGSGEEAELKDWLSRHLVKGMYLEKDLFEVETLPTIHGQELPIRAENGRLYLGNSRMLLTNVEARNGVIHIIYPGLAPFQ